MLNAMRNQKSSFRSAIPANAAYLEQNARENPHKLAQQQPGGPEIIGAVYIHPSAHVDPTAKVVNIVYNGNKYRY